MFADQVTVRLDNIVRRDNVFIQKSEICKYSFNNVYTECCTVEIVVELVINNVLGLPFITKIGFRLTIYNKNTNMHFVLTTYAIFLNRF